MHNAEHTAALERELALQFAPLDKRAFGFAIGLLAAAGVAGLTAWHLVLRPSPALPLALLAQFFSGYRVSWWGALVGGLWAFVAGFCAGWFVAFTRNLVLAVWLWLTRTRAQLAASRDFLDHV